MRATPSAEIRAGDPLPFESEATTHFSVVAPDGSAVSNTYTLKSLFGSGVTIPGSGFIMNDEMDNFTVKVGEPNAFGLIQAAANAIAPGKRPLSSMTPSIVLKDGHVRLVAGTPGGSTIINTVFQLVMNVVDFGLDAQEAVDALADPPPVAARRPRVRAERHGARRAGRAEEPRTRHRGA